MSKGSGDFDRDILDIIPERFDDDADSRQARAGHRLRSLATMVIAVLAVGGIVAAGLHFMGSKSEGGPGIPVIRADDRPIKTRPDDRGGMQVPNQDKLVYGRISADDGDARIERLLPPPEQPVVPPQIPVTSDKPRATPATEILRPPAPGSPLKMSEPPPPRPAPQTPVTAQPLAPEAPVIAQVPEAPVIAQAPQAPVTAQQMPQPLAPSQAADEGNYQPIQGRTPVPITPAQQAAPAAVAPTQTAALPVAPPAGDWLIQLGALRSQELADREWNRIKTANADLLGALKPTIMHVDLGEKGTFWRLRAGPLSEQAAKQLCGQLKERNQGCIIAR